MHQILKKLSTKISERSTIWKQFPTLIGGFTVEIGSKLIDTSIRGQLKQISNLLGA